MPILLDRNPLHIDSGRRRVPMTKRILRLDDAPRGLAHPPGKGVSRLVLPTDMVDNSDSLRDDPNRPEIDTRLASISTGRGLCWPKTSSVRRPAVSDE